MIHRFARPAALLGVLAVAGLASAQSITYQGLLNEAGLPADGEYDLRFRVYTSEVGGSQVGGTEAFSNVPVVDGLLTVDLDFGVGVFNGSDRWLQVEVRPGDSTGLYSVLSPRQPVAPAPFALFALSAPGGSGFWSANGSSIYKNNSGNVGIGFNNPARPLEVRGTIRAAYDGGSGPIVGLGTGTVELKSNSTGIDRPFGAVNFLDADNAVRATVQYGNGPGLLAPVAMRFGTEGITRMAIGSNGNVGVGTVAPAHRLHVVGGRIVSETSSIAIQGIKQGNGTFPGVQGETTSASSNAAGVRGYSNSETPGVNSAGVLGRNFATNSRGDGVRGTHAAGGDGVEGYSEAGMGVRGVSNSSSGYGGVFGDLGTPGKGVLVVGTSHFLSPISVGTTSIPSGVQFMVDGKARVDVLEIAGADVAEKFPTSENAAELIPGTVMEIDPQNAGKLRVARGEYNRRVAGVVSGAGNLPVGAVLGHLPGHEDAPPIALSGRVWVRCDAGTQGIELGDLLTTSNTPGHAMAVKDHARATGAVIGKAMTTLAADETGLVLVLVNLQ